MFLTIPKTGIQIVKKNQLKSSQNKIVPDGQEEIVIFDGLALVSGNSKKANPVFSNFGLSVDFDYIVRIEPFVDLPEYELEPNAKPIYFVKINLKDLHKELLYNPSESSNTEMAVNLIKINNGFELKHIKLICSA